MISMFIHAIIHALLTIFHPFGISSNIVESIYKFGHLLADDHKCTSVMTKLKYVIEDYCRIFLIENRMCSTYYSFTAGNSKILDKLRSMGGNRLSAFYCVFIIWNWTKLIYAIEDHYRMFVIEEDREIFIVCFTGPYKIIPIHYPIWAVIAN